MHQKRLTHKVALITGAGNWIGKEIAQTFARAGAHVFILEKNPQTLAQTLSEIQASGGIAAGAVVDIREETQVQAALQKAVAQYGKIDIIIQNAGIYPITPLETINIAEWREVIDNNLTGTWIVLKTALDLNAIDKTRGGKIIFISSTNGENIAIPGFSHYAASKAGINGLMRSAALELAKYNIQVNSIAPGNILNPEMPDFTEAEIREMIETIPLGRLGKPKDLANLALFLASDEASFITGQNFIVDGGEAIRAQSP